MAPFKSEAQRKFMYMKHPKIAARWSDEEKGKQNVNERIKKAMKGKKK